MDFMTNDKWTYEPSPFNEATATAVGFLRQAPYLAKPESNRNYSEGDIWEEWQHRITALSEIAWAAMYLGDTAFIPTYNTHKGEPDVGDWEVRYAFTRDDGFPGGLRFSTKVDNLSAPYILLIGGPERRIRRSNINGYATPPFHAVGWMYGMECVRPEFETHYSTPQKPSYEVPIANLRSMDELL